MVKSADQLSDSRGFSLVEVLVAIAIFSVISVVLFQSTSQQFQLVDRLAASVDRSLERVGSSATLESVLAGAVPGWPEDEEGVFRGNDRRFSGTTGAPLQSEVPGLASFSLSIVSDGYVETLVYESGDTVWELGRFNGLNGAFEYLTLGGKWSNSWPPDEEISLPPFGDESWLQRPPLPRAVRFRFADRAGADQIVWTANVNWRRGYLPRQSDLIE